MIQRRVLIVICMVVMSVVSEAESVIIPVGSSGLNKSDFDISLYSCSANLCESQSILDITVTDLGNNRDYLISNLPDPEPGSGVWYEVTMIPNNTPVRYAYPIQTRTPQSISSVVSYRIPGVPTLAAGDTLPSVDITVAGLSSDPTGATVTFTLWSVSTGVKVLDDVSAVISDIDAQSDGTWTATFRHNWLSSETSNLSGFYYGRFEVTFLDGGVMTIPPAPNSLRVQVHP